VNLFELFGLLLLLGLVEHVALDVGLLLLLLLKVEAVALDVGLLLLLLLKVEAVALDVGLLLLPLDALVHGESPFAAGVGHLSTV
jgi:hypothetical protein